MGAIVAYDMRVDLIWRADKDNAGFSRLKQSDTLPYRSIPMNSERKILRKVYGPYCDCEGLAHPVEL